MSDPINVAAAIERRLGEIARLKALRAELRALQRDAARVEAGRRASIPDEEFARRFDAARREAVDLGLGCPSLTASTIDVI